MTDIFSQIHDRAKALRIETNLQITKTDVLSSGDSRVAAALELLQIAIRTTCVLEWVKAIRNANKNGHDLSEIKFTIEDHILKESSALPVQTEALSKESLAIVSDALVMQSLIDEGYLLIPPALSISERIFRMITPKNMFKDMLLHN